MFSVFGKLCYTSILGLRSLRHTDRQSNVVTLILQPMSSEFSEREIMKIKCESALNSLRDKEYETSKTRESILNLHTSVKKVTPQSFALFYSDYFSLIILQSSSQR